MNLHPLQEHLFDSEDFTGDPLFYGDVEQSTEASVEVALFRLWLKRDFDRDRERL